MATAANVLKPDFTSHKKHFIFTEEHDQLRDSIARFVAKELAPHAEEWEETTFPDSIFPRMGELGFLGLSYPEEYGGQGGDYYCNIVLAEEMAGCKSGGVAMGVAVHTDMATPPVFLFGTEEQKQNYLVPSIKGTKISCLGITEPDAGSDVAGIKTRAVRDGDEWVINGSKPYITNGHRADYIVLVTKIEPARQMVYTTAWRFQNGEYPVREISMAKLYASQIAVDVADECIQIHGGAGYMKEYGIERVWRDMRLNRIGAGTDEIMLDVIGRSYGL